MRAAVMIARIYTLTLAGVLVGVAMCAEGFERRLAHLGGDS
ncbi:hypothetical protein [Rhodococcus rhodochrous]|nr:hypothetical protein [Rhodococcus rhodochrous]